MGDLLGIEHLHTAIVTVADTEINIRVYIVCGRVRTQPHLPPLHIPREEVR